MSVLSTFSRDALKDDQELDMLPFEKAQLRDLFDDSKHHTVTAVNILLFLQRRGVLDVDTASSEGKRILWNEGNVKRFLEHAMPMFYDAYSKGRAKAASLIEEYGYPAYQGCQDQPFEAGKIKGSEQHCYLLKHFTENYSAALYLVDYPTGIKMYANQVHKLVEITPQPTDEGPSEAQPQDSVDADLELKLTVDGEASKKILLCKKCG